MEVTKNEYEMPNTTHFDFLLILIFTKTNFNTEMTDIESNIPFKTKLN